jgi:predicted alpha/beta superfamily hydrolase
VVDGTWTPYASPGGGSVVGDLRVLAGVESPQLGGSRELYALLPPSYNDSADRAYPVLVLQDGRNLFDTSIAHSGEWEVDETMALLAAEGIEAIVVGVPNNGAARGSEYTPWPHPVWGGGNADAYVSFLVETVLPLVSASFRALDGPDVTAIGGSSLGGLVSLYGLLSRPETFGRALVMSPALWWSDEQMFAYARERASGHGRIWLDTGDAEAEEGQPELAQVYVTGVERMRAILLERGYDAASLRTVVDPGGVHREASWARRLPDALRFLLPRTS